MLISRTVRKIITIAFKEKEGRKEGREKVAKVVKKE